MEGVGLSSALNQQTMISMFLEVALGQTADTARHFLQATGWNLEEAVQLFYVGNEFGDASSSSPSENAAESQIGFENIIRNDGSEVRAPSPVRRDVLHDTAYSFDSYDMEQNVWEADQGSTSAAETSADNLASLYQPPFDLMFHGTFEKAKEAAKGHDRWLLVNVQSTREFSSHVLNRDTWGNETVAQTISSNFIFWQIYDDTEEGCKIITYYKLDSFPATLVIDPITGQKMYLWRGTIEAESLLEDVLQFTDSSPKNHLFSLSHKRRIESSHASPPKIQDDANEGDEKMKLSQALSLVKIKDVAKKEKVNYPALPEEPKGHKSVLCRVGFRLPDGSRVQRNFLRSDPIQLLWSFCAAKCGDEKPFKLTLAIPGAVKEMDYDSLLTFDESDVANSMISVTWE